MGISIKISGGLILFGAVMIVFAILGDMKDGEGTYWKIFYAGIGFMGFGAVLLRLFGRD